ncbi:hypothetical protein SLS62_006928 [Diatrype stigma]|uniref:O-methyltransferase C-terminal domain-containing protein n=1 Tax=Diatrype stigma TaxID=117547 RepID=A0AAN9YR88_9PEZI
MAAIPTPSLVDLATTILGAATSLQQQLKQNNMRQPSFEAATADGVRGRQDWQDAVDHPQLLEARSALIDASQLMRNLALGPTAMLADLTGPAISRVDVLRTLDALGVAQAVPLPFPLQEDDKSEDGNQPGKEENEEEIRAISIHDLAAKLGVVDPGLLHRHLRFAYLMGLFYEPRDGFVAHTAASAAMPSFSPWTQMRLGRLMSRGAWEVPGALRGQGTGTGTGTGKVKKNEAPHLPLPPVSLADPQGRSFWQILEEDDPERRGMEKFSASMKALLAGHTGNSLVPFVRGFDWAALVAAAAADAANNNDDSSGGEVQDNKGEDEGVLVVDVGGGHGHVEAGILDAVPPEIRFLVQDLASNERAAHETIRKLGTGAGAEAEKRARRVGFQVHDFFHPQPLPGPKPKPRAYILSRVLHDWRDGDCVRILRGLIPAMEKKEEQGGGSGGGGAKLFVYERVLPDRAAAATGKGDASIPNYMEQLMRTQDLLMFTLFGGGERSLADWRALFKAADERLEIAAVRHSPLSPFVSMEVVLV